MADDDLLMTRADYEKLQGEIEELETSARGEMAERIKAARELGDLKENAEYHDAKDAQAHLETKILRLQDQRRNAVVVEAAPTGSDKAALGSAVTVRDVESGRESTHTLVAAHESDPKHGRLSVESPMAHALAGASVGDVVAFEAPRGTRRLEVVRIA